MIDPRGDTADRDPTTYDPAVANRTVRLSRVAYRSEPDVIRILGEAGFSQISSFSGRSTQAVSAIRDGLVYVAFRGSESVADWLANARFLPSDREGGVRIHTGFLAALDEVWDAMDATVPAHDPIVVTGHSLGGALAHLAAWRWARTGRTVASVYTYGSPRVGHRDFSASYDPLLGTRTFRIINHVDVVTRVPLLIQGYRHVGRRVYFDGAQGLKVDASAWAIARDDVAFRIRNLRGPGSLGISLHLIGPYAALVGAPPA